MKKVYAFDFDGTLTTRDTLLEFIRFAVGLPRMMQGFALHLPWLVAMKLRLYPNWKAKQRIFDHFFGGMETTRFATLTKSFAAASKSLMRPEGLATLRKAVGEGAEVVIVSASIEDWVRPFFDEMGEKVHFACTRVEAEDGRLTGRFLTDNCYGAEKVNRLLAIFPNRESYHLTAFGDSRGDKELLAFADEGHFKPFRESVQERREERGEGRENTFEGDMRDAQGVKSQSSKFKVQRKDGGKPQTSRREKLGEIVRFGIVGVLATALQYGIYLAMLPLLEAVAPQWGSHAWVTTANTVAYLISFAFNFVASTRYTFKVKANAKRGAGFVFSHAVNYTMQTLCLNLFVGLGLSRQLAMLPTLCVCVPVNFVLVRFFLKR